LRFFIVDGISYQKFFSVTIQVSYINGIGFDKFCITAGIQTIF
jgi:hypothetical protein